MSPIPFLTTLLFVTGCAVQPEIKPKTTAQPFSVSAAPNQATKIVETRYEIRGYRDSADPTVRHASHSIFRRTRVPLVSPETEVFSRSENAPTSIAPLPASEELAVELASQKQISAELRALQVALTDAAEKMRTQYATLVRQSAEALKLRDYLESERNRLKESPVPASTTPGAANNTVTSNEVKW